MKFCDKMTALYSLATPGSWTLDPHYRMYIWGSNSQMIADDGGDEEGTLTRMRGVGANLPLAINGQLIVESHNALPAMLKAIRAAEGVIDDYDPSEDPTPAVRALRSALADLEGL
jgi:hypothetical protein